MATIGLNSYSSTNSAGPVDAMAYQPPAAPYQAPLTQAYQTSLGRAPGEGEVDRWWNMLPGNVDERVRSLTETTEAKNYAARKPTPTPPSGGGGNPQSIWQTWSQTNKARQSDPNSLAPFVEYLKQQGINATLDARTDGLHKGIYLNGDPNQFVKLLDGYDNPIWMPGGDRSGGGSGVGAMPAGGGGNVFSDPATAGWEALLRQVSEKLNTPQQTPGYENLVQYLNQYMQTLQGPAYTPGQSELIQNQVLDPMTQQRDARRQQILEQAAARGLSPKDGPVQQQLADLERQYSQARTQTQSGFATKAIGLEKDQQAQAAQVGQMLQALEQGQQTGNEGRALQAVSLMGQIPALADSRLGAANQTLSATNAPLASILSYILNQQGMNNQQEQFDSQQNADYWQQIGALLGNAFT